MITGGQPVRQRGIRMSVLPARPHRVVVIGGGFSGTLFALKLASARSDWTVHLVESRFRAGRGLAYGACEPQHLLNVPAARMEVGLRPRFAEWLRSRPGFLREALDESKGVLADAFVPRQVFGDYLEQRLVEALSAGSIRLIHNEAVGITRAPRQIVFADSRVLPVDTVVLATGNLTSHLPFRAKASGRIINDPWQPGALDQIKPGDSVLLLGTGLTMIDMLLVLRSRGHEGPLHAISRHGLLPKSHVPGGSWPAFLHPGMTPLQALRAIRANVAQAESLSIPWQRVIDAVRPVVASLWHSWGLGQRSQFLRHLRTIWDVHRHRMADRISGLVNDLLWNGVLTITAGRVLTVDERKGGLTAMIRPRGQNALIIDFDAIINCTGPAIDLRHTCHPLLRTLLSDGQVRSDPLGIGLDTEDCAAMGSDGKRSDWLYALGPLTRPAWWEITAVPEINAQIDRLVHQFSQGESEPSRPLAAIFLDIGAGI
jgi:uncharacterized NAD(P)/FAD-binding protein YdhS